MRRIYLVSFFFILANNSIAQNDNARNSVATPVTVPPHEHLPSVAADPAIGNSNLTPLDQSDMAIETDEAPENARAPDAYSAGFTKKEGPYTLPLTQRLVLADGKSISSLLGNRVEYTPQSRTGNYELQAWHGTSFNRLVIKTEGAFSENAQYENETEILWGHAFSSFWDSHFGVRFDSRSSGKTQQWFAAGVKGIAPYWFELDATAYLGNAGQSEFVFDSDYELLLTQRLILQPRAEFKVRGKDDPANLLGSGLANAAISLRLRYEFSRQFAPFVGVETEKSFGSTAGFVRRTGDSVKDTRYFAGIRFWF